MTYRNKLIQIIGISIALLFVLSGFSVITYGNPMPNHHSSSISQNSTKNSNSKFLLQNTLNSSFIKYSSSNILYNITRFPTNPTNNQSVFILIKSPNIGKVYLFTNISIKITITIIDTIGIINPILNFFNFSIDIPTIYNPISKGYISAIPSLPNFTFSGLLAKYTVTSYVSYYAMENNTIYSPTYSYTVNSTSSIISSSFVYAFSSSLLNAGVSNLTDYYYGLSNPGFISYQNVPNKIDVLTISDKNITVNNVSLQYNISGGGWNNVTVTATKFDSSYSSVLSSLNNEFSNISNTINTISQRFNITLKLKNDYSPIHLFSGTIPGINLDNYVLFRSKVNINSNISISPTGMYFITNQNGKKVFFVDPHPFMWLLSYDWNNLSQFYHNSIFNFYFSSKFRSAVSLLSNISILLENSQFEYLYKLTNYNFYVSYPSNDTPIELSSFTPSLIALDDLYLGIQNGPQILDWDLGSISYNSSNVESYILNYTENNHTGLIVTSGTLSDSILWNYQSSPTTIGALYDIGNTLENCTILNATVISSAIGMPLLPFYEFVKNFIANQIYPSAPPYSAGIAEAIGSAPLLIPNVPWNGTIIIYNSSVLQGLPTNLSIKYENPYQKYGYNATSDIGWQLALPLLLNHLLSYLNNTNLLYNYSAYGNLSKILLSLPSNYSKNFQNFNQYINYSFENYLKEIFTSLSTATILNLNNTLKITFENKSHYIPLPTKIIHLLMSMN
ncbi:MAG: hypothetical protein QXO31_04835, partial [Thermoplasmata archaeon]